MKDLRNLALLFLALTLISASGLAFVLEGDSAIEESDGVRITVSPHTASSPVKKYKQAFSFENKLSEDLTSLRAVLLFSEQPKITMQKWAAPQYETVQYSEAFDTAQYQWEVNNSIARVYYTSDTNGFAEQVTVWEREINSYSECPEGICFYWDVEQLAYGNKWENVESLNLLGETEFNGQSAWYYYTDSFDLPAGETAEWKIKYSASKNSGKWTLALVQGSADCLSLGTCEKQWVLDPWWASGWNSRYAINDLEINSDLPAHSLIRLEDVNFSALNLSCFDLNDLRIVNEETGTELKRVTSGNASTENGTIVFALENPLTAGVYSGKFYIYANNFDCPTPPTNIYVEGPILEDFEDMSDWSKKEGGGWILQTDVAISGKALKLSGGGLTRIREKAFNTTDWGVWFYKGGPTNQLTDFIKIVDMPVDLYYLMLFFENDRLKTYNPTASFETRLTEGTWYFLRIETAGQITYNIYLYDAEMNLLERITVLSYMNGNSNAIITPDFRLWLESYYNEVYFDQLQSVEIGYVSTVSFTIGEEELYDSDGDGIGDEFDQCPATPSGEPVDPAGCSCSQKTCDDGNPCTDDPCNWETAACEFVNDNSNVCGFPRNCTDSTCILKEEPPFFYWKLFPEDGRDYCSDGNCLQYSCELVSFDANAECSFADTSELEAKMEELEGKVEQLEQQNLGLQGQMNLLEASVNSLQQAFNKFVQLVNSYLFALPQGLRQGMLCSALQQSGETSGDGFGLHCEINEMGKCNCTAI